MLHGGAGENVGKERDVGRTATHHRPLGVKLVLAHDARTAKRSEDVAGALDVNGTSSPTARPKTSFTITSPVLPPAADGCTSTMNSALPAKVAGCRMRSAVTSDAAPGHVPVPETRSPPAGAVHHVVLPAGPFTAATAGSWNVSTFAAGTGVDV